MVPSFQLCHLAKQECTHLHLLPLPLIIRATVKHRFLNARAGAITAVPGNIWEIVMSVLQNPLRLIHICRGWQEKYMKSEYEFQYEDSLYSMKPILKSSEIDDSRPTVIRVHSKNPSFISVLSGKINTVYDLEDVLTNE